MLKNEIIIIFGKRRSGKTTLNKHLLKYKSRLLIFDPMKEHNDGKIFYCLSSLLVYLKQKTDGLFRIIFRPEDPLEKLSFGKTVFEVFCEIVYCLYDVTVAFEELDMITQGNICPPILRKMIAQGGHQKISLYVATRRPAEIPKLLTSQANKIFSFRQHEPRDINYFREFVGEKIEDAKNLGKHEYLEFDLDNQAITKGRLKL